MSDGGKGGKSLKLMQLQQQKKQQQDSSQAAKEQQQQGQSGSITVPTPSPAHVAGMPQQQGHHNMQQQGGAYPSATVPATAPSPSPPQVGGVGRPKGKDFSQLTRPSSVQQQQPQPAEQASLSVPQQPQPQHQPQTQTQPHHQQQHPGMGTQRLLSVVHPNPIVNVNPSTTMSQSQQAIDAARKAAGYDPNQQHVTSASNTPVNKSINTPAVSNPTNVINPVHVNNPHVGLTPKFPGTSPKTNPMKTSMNVSASPIPHQSTHPMAHPINTSAPTSLNTTHQRKTSISSPRGGVVAIGGVVGGGISAAAANTNINTPNNFFSSNSTTNAKKPTNPIPMATAAQTAPIAPTAASIPKPLSSIPPTLPINTKPPTATEGKLSSKKQTSSRSSGTKAKDNKIVGNTTNTSYLPSPKFKDGTSTATTTAKGSTNTKNASNNKSTPPLVGPKLSTILKNIDPSGSYSLDPEAEEQLLSMANDFADDLIRKCNLLAKHRGERKQMNSSNTTTTTGSSNDNSFSKVEVEDVALMLTKQYGLSVPGLAGGRSGLAPGRVSLAAGRVLGTGSASPGVVTGRGSSNVDTVSSFPQSSSRSGVNAGMPMSMVGSNIALHGGVKRKLSGDSSASRKKNVTN